VCLTLSLSDRLRLCTLPSPLHKLELLSRKLATEVWVKRDDLTGFAMGGNKARKAEFLLADALRKDCDVILTAGSIQSNHARVIAAAARRFSVDCHLFLTGEQSTARTGNMLLNVFSKAQIHCFPSQQETESGMKAFAEELGDKGNRPYVIPVGGSNEIGALGYVLGFQELESQLLSLTSKPTTLIFASSSGGTHAGILAGRALTKSQVKLLGIRVDRDPNLEKLICSIGNALSKRLGLTNQFQPRDVTLNSDYVGENYGVPSEAGVTALKELWGLEGILLDPVYTAKAMAGLIDLACKQTWADERVVFLHSGGMPSVFAFLPQLLAP
jgi:L-cysteate sulfo-lyase